MAIKGKQAKNERKLYTGLVDLKLRAVNPDRDALMELLGTENISDSMVQYNSTDEDGTEKLRLDFWVENREHDILNKMSLFLSNKVRTSSSGKTQFINNVGQTAWQMSEADLASLSWFKTEGVREAYDGEETLYDLLVNWCNIDTRAGDAELVLETSMEDLIVNGNVEELQELIAEIFTENQFRALLTVGNNQYQNVYTKKFLKTGSNKTKGLLKTLEYSAESASKNGGTPPNYQGDLKFQEFDALSARPDTTVESATDSEVADTLRTFV